MSDESDNDMLVPDLHEAAAIIPQRNGNQKRMKQKRYLMERICQLQDQKEYGNGPKISQALGISHRTYYRLTADPEFAKVQEKYRNKSLERAEMVKTISASDALEDFRNECKAILEDCKPKLRLMVQSDDERLAMDALKFVVEQVAALQAKTPDEFTQGMLDALPNTDTPQ